MVGIYGTKFIFSSGNCRFMRGIFIIGKRHVERMQKNILSKL